jgi:dihydrodipicolinate synthase/N-acetylneuraminate lyase
MDSTVKRGYDNTPVLTGTSPAALKAALAAGGVGERWLVPPRLPLTDEEAGRVMERLTALGVC